MKCSEIGRLTADYPPDRPRLTSGIPLWIDQPPDRGHTISGNAELARVLVNGRLVWREIDTVDAVVGDVAVKPLNLRSDASQDCQRSHRDVPDLLLGHLSGAGNIALNHEFRHGVRGRIPCSTIAA